MDPHRNWENKRKIFSKKRNPINGKFIKEAMEERFWKRVKKTKTCWNWIGAHRGKMGYGLFSIGGDNEMAAHRFSWELHQGPIPRGLCVLHKCDNPPCVNPSHLFIGSHQDNMRDRVKKLRTNRKLQMEDVKKIRKSHPVISAIQLARKFNVTQWTIFDVLKKRSWRWL